MKKKLFILAALFAVVCNSWADSWTWSYSGISDIGGKGLSNYTFSYDTTNEWWSSIIPFTGKLNGNTDEQYWTVAIANQTGVNKNAAITASGGIYIYGNATTLNYPTRVVVKTTAFNSKKVSKIEYTMKYKNCAATVSATVNGVSYGSSSYELNTTSLTQEVVTFQPTGDAQAGTIELAIDNSEYDGLAAINVVCAITITFVEETTDTNTYYIIGDVTGGWENENDLQLTLSGGKYQGSVTDFVATNDSYAYKVRANQNWTDYVLPAGNDNYYWYPKNNDGIGIYRLDFAVTPASNAVELTATKTADLKVYAVGSNNEETSAAIFSGIWDAAATTDEMTLDANGYYTISWENVALEAQTIKAKVIAKKNASDSEALAYYGGTGDSYNNVLINIAEAGNYDIAIHFNPKADNLENNSVWAEVAKHKEDFTVTYVNVNDWSTVYAYAWNGEKIYTNAWRGTEMTKTSNTFNNHDIYTITINDTEAPANIIFNDGGSNQTDNLTFVTGQQYWDDANDANFIRYDYPNGGYWKDECTFSAYNSSYTSTLGGITWTIGDLTWNGQTLYENTDESERSENWLDPTNLGISTSNDYIQLSKGGSDYFVTRTISLTSQAFAKKVKRVTVKPYTYSDQVVNYSVYVGETLIGSTTLPVSGKQTVTITASEPVAGAVKLYFEQPTTTKALYLYEIHIMFEDGEEVVSVSDAGYATFVSDKNLDYSSVSGLTAYKATVDGQTITFSQVTTVPAGEGVLVKAAEGSYDVPVVLSLTAWGEADNAFVRGTGDAVASDNSDGTCNYILNKVTGGVAFCKANGQTVATNRAYLTSTTNNARLVMKFDDGTVTGISTVDAVQPTTNIYDLQGRRVAEPQKGLYIMNGKKVVMK